jgi:hypothetical protein
MGIFFDDQETYLLKEGRVEIIVPLTHLERMRHKEYLYYIRVLELYDPISN